MPAARKRFFISYSRADKDLVEPVVAILRTAPTDVFFDIDSIEPGEIWSDRLERAINGASSFFIFWCNHSANSSWVRKEWTFAVGKRKRIIPIILDSTILPPELETFQGINCRRFSHDSHFVPVAAKMISDRPAKKLSRARFVGFILVAAIAGLAVVNLLPHSSMSRRAAIAAPAAPAGLPAGATGAAAAAAATAAAAAMAGLRTATNLPPRAAPTFWGIFVVVSIICLILAAFSFSFRKERQLGGHLNPPKLKDDDINGIAQLLRQRLLAESSIREESEK
jgi:hypothetical protein